MNVDFRPPARQMWAAVKLVKSVATKIVDWQLAPRVKAAMQAEGMYCPPEPRWWVGPTYLWYLVGCYHRAYCRQLKRGGRVQNTPCVPPPRGPRSFTAGFTPEPV